MLILRQSTASQEVLLGPFLDSTDGNTAETGLTIANTDIKLWKHGATSEANKNSGGATHIAAGRYYAVLDATDTNTVGMLEINVHVSGALAVRREFQVLEEAVYDALFAASATGALPVSSGGIASTAFATGAITAGAIAADAIGASELAADAVTEIQSGLATAAALATVDSNVDAILTDTGTTLPATLATIAGYLDTEIAAVLADTNELQGDWANGGRLDLLLDAVKAVTDALPDSGALTSVATAASIAALNDPTAAAIADAVWDEAIAGHAGAGSTGEALSDAGAAGTPPTVGEIADAVWDEDLTGHTTTDSAGEILGNVATGTPPSAAAIRAEIDSNSTQLAAIVADTNELQGDWANGGRLDLILDARSSQTSVDDLPTNAELTAALASADDAVLAQVALVKAVTDALPDSGALTSLATAAALATVDSNVDAVLTDTGTTLPATLATIAGYIDTEMAAVLADTNELQGDWANGGRLDLLLDAVKAVTDALPDSGALTSLATAAALQTVDDEVAAIDTVVDAILVDTAVIGAAGAGLTAVPWNAAWDAEVQSEVTDALEVTLSDSIPSDGTAPSVKQALYMLTQFMLERSVSGTTVTVKKPDGSTSLFTLTLDDGTSPTSITRAT